MPSGLSPEHRDMLDRIYGSWVADGKWPVFAEIDKALDRAGQDALELLRELFPSHILCEPGGMPPTNDTELRLTSTGLGALTTQPSIADTFLAAITFLAKTEQQHTPTPQEPSAVVTSGDLASYLETSTRVPRPRSVADQMASSLTPFLLADGWLWTNFSNNAEGWILTISREIRRFRDVSSLEDYHQRRRESLAPETPPAIPGTTRHRAPQMAVPEAAMTLKTPDPRSVFIVHGRDLAARDALADFLRDLGLRPIDFEQMVTATGSAAPYIGEAVTAGFKEAQAVIVLLTPDDEARLLQQLRGPDEPLHERELTGQARPNVLFEAGMALAMHPTRTVFVEIGKLRPFTDVAGRHTVRLNGISSLHTLAKRLETAGCQVNYSGPDWLRVERFTTLLAHTRAPVASSADPTPDTPQQLPRG